MLQFFTILFYGCKDLFLALWLKSSKTTLRYRLDQLDEAAREATAQAATTDVYFGVGLQSEDLGPSKRGTVADISGITAFWFDLDIAGEGHTSPQYPTSIENAMEFVKGLPLQPSGIVNSGGGLHLYWLLDQLWVFTNDGERQQAQELSRSFQGVIIEEGYKFGWKLDNTSDLTRLLRVPATLNHKSSPPKAVELLLMEDRRYSLKDFEVMTIKSESAVTIQSVQMAPNNAGYPPADADQIVLHCAWMSHCKEDAAILSEPVWYRMLSVLARCSDGSKIAHEWSVNYPKYNFRETENKIKQSLKNAGPATCSHIYDALDGKGYCNNCPFFGFIASPIQLGNSDELTQAKFTAVAAIKDYKANPGTVYSDNNIRALALIQKQEVAVYQSLRQAYILIPRRNYNYALPGSWISKALSISRCALVTSVRI